VSAAIERYDEARNLAPDMIVGSISSYLMVALLVLTDDVRPLAEVVTSMEVIPGSFADGPQLVAVAATAGTDQAADAGRQIAQVVTRTVAGRVFGQEGDYLLWFAWLRHRIGDDQRAAELLDRTAGRFTRRLATLMGQQIHGWSDDHTQQQMTTAIEQARDVAETHRRQVRSSQLLAEEVRHWAI